MAANNWHLQRKKRTKGWYYEAIWGRGKTRTAVSLGYLTDAEADSALNNLRFHGRRLLATQDGEPLQLPTGTTPGCVPGRLLTNAEIKAIALQYEDGADALVAFEDSAALEHVERGDYGELTLSEFFKHVYKPIRMSENPRTWKQEKHMWPQIEAGLGHYKVCDLDVVKWSTFLRGRETWSGRTRAIAQGYYRGLLKYAVEIEAIHHVHACRRIKGYNSRVKPPGEALTAEEVSRLLDAADTPMHRALFGYAFGQGLRPAEVTALSWEDIDWEGGVVVICGTKNEAAKQRVPLTPASRAELMPYWKSLGSPSSGVAFMWRAKPLKSWRKAFRRSVERANLNPDGTRRIIPYSARYTFATLGVVAGISDAAMRQAMRHSSRSRVLETTYQRLQLGQVKAELAAFPVFREVPEQRAQGGQLEKGSATD